jgi:N6-adenosine-specific RNA methylase IME4
MKRADWPFSNLRQEHYPVILADPPWKFETYSDKGKGRSPERHYPTMSIWEVEELPVQSLAKPYGALLFLWTSGPMMERSLRVMRAWGFIYSTVAFVWHKMRMGLGYWTRSECEFVLLGRRGGSVERQAKDVEQFTARLRKAHSAKPEIIQDRIEKLVEGPYCELFARRKRAGWDCWGNELETQK